MAKSFFLSILFFFAMIDLFLLYSCSHFSTLEEKYPTLRDCDFYDDFDEQGDMLWLPPSSEWYY